MKIITYWTLFVLSLFFWSSVYSMNHSEDIFFVRHGHSYKGSIIAYNENLNTIRHECNKNHYRIAMVTFEQSQGNKTKGFIKNLFILEKYKDYNLAPDLIVKACKTLCRAGCTTITVQSPLFDNITLSFSVGKHVSEGSIVALAKNHHTTINNDLGIVGFKYSNDVDNQKGFITNISITESYKEKSLGQHLLEYACKFLEERGCTDIEAETSMEDENTLDFFKKNNFEERTLPTNNFVNDIQDPLLYGMIIMYKNLTL